MEFYLLHLRVFLHAFFEINVFKYIVKFIVFCTCNTHHCIVLPSVWWLLTVHVQDLDHQSTETTLYRTRKEKNIKVLVVVANFPYHWCSRFSLHEHNQWLVLHQLKNKRFKIHTLDCLLLTLS